MNRWARLAGMALLAASTLSLGCGGGEEATPAQAAGGAEGARGGARGGRGGAGQVVPVVAAKAELKDMPIDVTSIGTVEAYTTVSVRPQVTGALLEASFREGDFVRKGQVLFKIDPRPYEAELARAKATLLRDKALAENNRTQAERFKKLLAEGVAPAQQVDSALSAADATDATVVSDEVAIRQAELNLAFCTIEAPLDGYTGTIMVEPGNLVRASDAALVVINQVHPIQVNFAVPQQHLADIKRYMARGRLRVTATLPNDPGPAELGHLVFVDNAVDPTTGTIRLRGEFDNRNSRLWPGLFVNASLRLSDRPNTLVVPSQAVSTNQTGQFVYVVKDDHTVEARSIIAGAAIDGQSMIQEGLKAGETVVIDGQLRLVPGSRVEITNRAADDTPAPPGEGTAASNAAAEAGRGRGQGRGAARGQGQ